MTKKWMLIFAIVNTLAIIFIYTVILADAFTISLVIRSVFTSVFALVIMWILERRKVKKNKY
jgi:hypothetical protein